MLMDVSAGLFIMNLTADIKEQPFRKTARGDRNLFIKIEGGEGSAHHSRNFDKHTVQNINLVVRNIREARARVVESKLVLDMSHRQ